MKDDLCKNCAFDPMTCPGVDCNYDGQRVVECDGYTEPSEEIEREERNA